jgi:hypothetical protein
MMMMIYLKVKYTFKKSYSHLCFFLYIFNTKTNKYKIEKERGN